MILALPEWYKSKALSFCNTSKQKTLEQSPKASEDADEESYKDLSDKNAEDFTNHKRTLNNGFVAPREVVMGAKDKQS